ncbi:MAG: FTR1 family iron permease [Methylocella sp.]
MVGALIIVFREVIEAGLIVGIVLAATHGVLGRARWIWVGIGVGIGGAALLATFVGAISDAVGGAGQELFNAFILGIAVVMLAWHSIWMTRKGREMASRVRAVGQAISMGTRSLSALAFVVGIAVLREGSEIVLFLYGIMLSARDSGWSLFGGGATGLVLGCSLSFLTYRGLLTIPPRYLFGVTNTLIAFLAAGMAAQCVHYLEQANVVTIMSATLWNTSATLSEKSILGRVLHTLVGYSDQPTAFQGLAYVLTLAAIFVFGRIFSSLPPSRPAISLSGHRSL